MSCLPTQLHHCTHYNTTAKYRTVASVPTDPHEQLHLAIRAVFDSWMTPRAIRYRLVWGLVALMFVLALIDRPYLYLPD